MDRIHFNKPLKSTQTHKYLDEVYSSNKFSGDGEFTKKCTDWFEDLFKTSRVLLTTSCTHALEMCAHLLNIQEGDEVIMPSFTFSSTANAFILRGAKVVFVDIRPDTMNIDEKLIENAITSKTKAIVVVHYAGNSCEIDPIKQIADRHKIYLIEDAAQAMLSKYKNKYLGTIGHLGCFSFHDTKNFNAGEGGLLIINDVDLIQRAEIIREKGTNRSQFFRGLVDKYRWIDIGSSYLPSELNAAFLYPQLLIANDVNSKRVKLYNRYYNSLKNLPSCALPTLTDQSQHNGHIFFIKLNDETARQDLIYYLESYRIQSCFHYIPLHSSIRCKSYYRFDDEDKYSSIESSRLLRLPMYYDLELEQVDYVVSKIKDFING